MKSPIDRALGMAVTLVAIAILVRWAWTLIRPMLPILIAGGAIYLLGLLLLNRFRRL